MKGEANPRIDALTSLRFFAAAMIVVLHLEKNFGIPKNPVPFLSLEQGVGFFFVLSGFILYYNYSRIEGGDERRRFWLARFARVWPVHVTTFLLTFLLVPYDEIFLFGGAAFEKLRIGLLNLGLLHSLTLNPTHHTSINSPSWSISTEAIFYLLFPFLTVDFARRWKFQIILSFAMIWSGSWLLAACGVAHYPGPGYDGVTIHSYINTHPLSRAFEFILGMTACHFFLLKRSEARAPGARATLIEVFWLLASLLASYACVVGYRFFKEEHRTLASWLRYSGGSLAFSGLIYAYAREEGALSRALRHKALVYLGEISFSLYMVHQLVLRYYEAHDKTFFGLSKGLELLIYLALCLAASAGLHEWVETPARKWIFKRRV